MKGLLGFPLRCSRANGLGRCVAVLLFLVSSSIIYPLYPQRLNGQATGQTPAPSPVQSQPDSNPAAESSAEMAVKDQAAPPNLNDPARFRVNVKLVLARVVVRDANGHVVGNLHKEDFELFDNGKLQVISNFDVEHLGRTDCGSWSGLEGHHPGGRASVGRQATDVSGALCSLPFR
jgi:hypothetical protein